MKWWTDFLKQAEPLKLQGSTKNIRTWEGLKNYVEVQTRKSCAIYADVLGSGALLELIQGATSDYTHDDIRIIKNAQYEVSQNV